MTGFGVAESAIVTATFDRLDGSPTFERQVQLQLRDRGYVWMVGGPTGYESLPAEAGPFEKPWSACAGTPGRWDSCIVSAAEMNRAFRDMGLLP